MHLLECPGTRAADASAAWCTLKQLVQRVMQETIVNMCKLNTRIKNKVLNRRCCVRGLCDVGLCLCLCVPLLVPSASIAA
jgi:hypothetical protein